jgi:hypothetical protein
VVAGRRILEVAVDRGIVLVVVDRDAFGVEAGGSVPVEEGSKCSLEAVGRGNVEVAVDRGILLGEAGTGIFVEAVCRHVVGEVDNEQLVFRRRNIEG